MLELVINGTFVNGRKVTAPTVVTRADKIAIGDYIVEVSGGSEESSRPAAVTRAEASSQGHQIAAQTTAQAPAMDMGVRPGFEFPPFTEADEYERTDRLIDLPTIGDGPSEQSVVDYGSPLADRASHPSLLSPSTAAAARAATRRGEEFAASEEVPMKNQSVRLQRGGLEGDAEQDVPCDMVAELGAKITAWLSEDQGPDANEQLLAWLQGYDFPPLGHDEEPYHWILRALVSVENRHAVEYELARRSASILRAQPDVRRPGKRPEQVLENLLYLCAGLACPEVLFPELLAMYERRSLVGEWSSGDLRSALRAALIPNQVDRCLEGVWRVMLEGRRHPFLPGRPFDGFEGILYMPDSLESADAPLLAPIGFALGRMASYLEARRDRENQFERLIKRLLNVYPDRPSWDADLAAMPQTHSWPDWTANCLKNLAGRQ